MNGTKMKVKIFNEYDKPTTEYGYCKAPLEKRINDFIKDKMANHHLQHTLVDKLLIKCSHHKYKWLDICRLQQYQ